MIFALTAMFVSLDASVVFSVGTETAFSRVDVKPKGVFIVAILKRYLRPREVRSVVCLPGGIAVVG